MAQEEVPEAVVEPRDEDDQPLAVRLGGKPELHPKALAQGRDRGPKRALAVVARRARGSGSRREAKAGEEPAGAWTSGSDVVTGAEST